MKNFISKYVDFNLLSNSLKKNKNMVVIFTILLLIPFPFALIVRLLSSSAPLDTYLYESFVILLLIATVPLFIATPFMMFNYLTSKKSVDFFHALPIKRRKLFVTNALLSYLLVMIPFTISYVLGQSISQFVFVTPNISYSVAFYFSALLLFATIQIPCFIVIMNTGTTSDSIIYSIILFIAPFIAYFAYEVFASTYLFGLGSFVNTNLLSYISPIYALIRTYSNSISEIIPWALLLYWFVMSLLAYKIVIELYESWKSERSELPFNNTVFFYFVSAVFIAILLVFCISLFPFNPNSSFKFLAIQNLIIPLFISFVVYVILDTIRKRSFRNLVKSLKRFAVIGLSTLLITTFIFVTEGFGYMSRIPDRERIQNITLESSNLDWDPHFSYFPTELKLETERDIELFISIHERLTQEFKMQNKFFGNDFYSSQYYPDADVRYTGSYISFKYELEGRTDMKRSYYLPEAMIELTYDLLNTDSYRDHLLDLLNQPSSQIKVYNNTMNKVYMTSSEEYVEALHKDFSQLQYDPIIPLELHNVVYLSSMKVPLFIDSRFINTLSLIDESKLEQSNLEIAMINSVYNTNYGLSNPSNYYSNPAEEKPLSSSELEAMNLKTYVSDLNNQEHKAIRVYFDESYSVEIAYR